MSKTSILEISTMWGDEVIMVLIMEKVDFFIQPKLTILEKFWAKHEQELNLRFLRISFDEPKKVIKGLAAYL